MASTKNLLIGGLAAIIIAGLFGTAAFAVLGQRAAVKPGAAGKAEIMIGTNTAAAPAAADSSSRSSAPAGSTLAAPARDGVASSTLAYPYYGGGPFQPGAPPYGFNPGVSADGISAWGVAYKKTTDANAKVGADLVKAAFDDARSQAAVLATATGLSVGKVVAVNDFTVTEPYYNVCVQPAPAIGVPNQPGPAPDKGASGSSGSGIATPVKPGIVEPAPTCTPDHYMVAWVMVRFAIA
jgi:hypothetical protein